MTSSLPTRQNASTRATTSTVCTTPHESLAASAAEATRSCDLLRQLVDEVVTVSSCRAAELAKLLENTFRMVNIALVNELAMLCADQGIDTWEVIEAAASKPFGFMPFYPGPGVGGHCIPLDPTYLTWQSRRTPESRFGSWSLPRTSMHRCRPMSRIRVVETLNVRGMSVKGASVLALGVTYKPNVGDIRESAAIAVLEQLHRKGARLAFHDPFVSRCRKGWHATATQRLYRRRPRRADCVLVLTPHDAYDLEDVAARASLVFDARDATPHPGSRIRGDALSARYSTQRPRAMAALAWLQCW